MGGRKATGCTTRLEGWWPRGFSLPPRTGGLLAGRVLRSPLRQACKVAQRDRISAAYRQAEGGLALVFPAHGLVEEPNDPRNRIKWACLCPEEYLQVLQEKDGGSEDSPFHRARGVWGEKRQGCPTVRGPLRDRNSLAFPQRAGRLMVVDPLFPCMQQSTS